MWIELVGDDLCVGGCICVLLLEWYGWIMLEVFFMMYVLDLFDGFIFFGYFLFGLFYCCLGVELCCWCVFVYW